MTLIAEWDLWHLKEGHWEVTKVTYDIFQDSNSQTLPAIFFESLIKALTRVDFSFVGIMVTLSSNDEAIGGVSNRYQCALTKQSHLPKFTVH